MGDAAIPREASASKVNAGKHVSDAKCFHWALDQPAKPEKQCPATTRCVHWIRTYTPRSDGEGDPYCDKRCGTSAYPIHTANHCMADKGGSATSRECHFWKKKPPTQQSRTCPSTSRCVKWVSRFTSSCPSSCGQGASTLYTSSYCVAATSGAAATGECARWGVPRPGASAQNCPGTAACRVYIGGGSCCYLVNYADSPWSCARCRGGNKYAGFMKCVGSGSNGGTRRCR